MYYRFSYAGTWELVNLLEQKMFGYHICYENIGRKQQNTLRSQDKDRSWTDRTDQYASEEDCIE